MTIKEMEIRSGLNRANIRFYEKEGLLFPARQENGYREYSEKDLAVLERIKLLRSLGLSLEEIRAVQKGEKQLDRVLEEHESALAGQARELEQAREICRAMRADCVEYESLDAGKYLRKMEEERTPSSPGNPAFQADRPPQVFIPWRRFFARMLDLLFYELLWSALAAALRLPPVATAVGLEAALCWMLVLEPLFLSRLGTTPGKWLFGMRVTDNDGRNMTYGKAFWRTLQAVWWGMGAWLPVFSLVRGGKSFYDYSHEKTLPWEYDSELLIQDERLWRFVPFSAACAGLAGLLTVTLLAGGLPPCRGDLTVEELAKNYRFVQRYHGWNGTLSLDETGRFTERPAVNTGVVVSYDESGHVIEVEEDPLPAVAVTQEQDRITGLTMEMSVLRESVWSQMVPCWNEGYLLVEAYALGRKEAGLLGRENLVEAVQEILDAPFENHRLQVCGIALEYTVDYSDLQNAGGFLKAVEDGVPGEFSLTLSLRTLAEQGKE